MTAYFDQLGDISEIEKNTFKPFSCGIVMHLVIDGAIQLSNDIKSQSGSLDGINSVDLRVNPEVLIFTGKTDPQTGLEGKFSNFYHAAAIGSLYGEASPFQFTDDTIRDATVVEMRKKIQVSEDSTVSKAEAYISLNFADGTPKEKHVRHAKGSIEKPHTDAELQNKFME